MSDKIIKTILTMIFLTGAAAEAVSAEVTGAEVITQVAEPVQETLNILDLAVKGGWIMIVLAILSILGIYIFVERFMTLRKAMQKNPYLLDRINDNLRDNDPKSALSTTSPLFLPCLFTGNTKCRSGCANCCIFMHDGHTPHESPSWRDVQFRYCA